MIEKEKRNDIEQAVEWSLTWDVAHPDSSSIIMDHGSQHDDSKLRLWVLCVAAVVEKATIALGRLQKINIEFLTQGSAVGYIS
jgi:hypothetical protein